MFVFRFETLLKVRRINLEKAQQAFAQAQRQLLEFEARLREIREDLLRQDREYLERSAQGITGAEIMRLLDWRGHLELSGVQIAGEIQQARQEVDASRQELLKAQQEVKAMERLKELDRERHEQALAKKEMNFIDEIAITRHGRTI